MARFEDYGTSPEVKDIVEAFIKKFPRVFEGFSVDDIFFIVTKKKKVRGRHPIKVKSVPYPHYVASGYTYVFETFETKWEKFNKKQKNLAVFHAMCAIPVGGFDAASTKYGKLVKPDFQMYRQEFAASGGVPDWDENDSARDPMKIKTEDVPVPTAPEDEDPIPAPKDGKKKSPVTAEAIAMTDSDDAEVKEAS